MAKIQPVRRLVHKDHFRALNQRARDVRQLPLAAAEKSRFRASFSEVVRNWRVIMNTEFRLLAALFRARDELWRYDAGALGVL